MPELPVDTLPSPGVPCPNCGRHELRALPGERAVKGPFRSRCDFCGFEQTQVLDSQRNNRTPGQGVPR